MGFLLAGLGGVALGALITAAVLLYLLQKRADRDLIERRLRACAEYRECLGDMARVLDHQGGDGEVLEQAWRNVGAFCREVRLTSWLFDAALRARLAAVVERLEAEGRRSRENGAGAGGRAAQLLCGEYHEVERLLQREIGRQLREFRRFRFLPDVGSRAAGDEEDAAHGP
jgi:hypothetical protein